MADFPADLTSKSRDTIIQEYLRDFALRYTQLGQSIDTSPGSHAWVNAKTLADALQSSQANQTLIARRTLIKQLFGTKLDEYGESRGLPRLEGTRSFGTVKISTSVGGTTIGAGNVSLVNVGDGTQYTASTGTYADGSLVTVQSVTLGSATNVFPGTKLRFSSPSAGLAPDAVVFADANGRGLSGGSDLESDEDYQNRLIDDFRNPQGNGNRSEIRALIQESSPNTRTGRTGHGVPVECGFVYPCALGPGSFAFTFTVQGKGLERLPSGAQLAAVEAYVKANIGADYSIFTVALSNDPVATALKPAATVTFSPNVNAWLDLQPFPRYYGAFNGFPTIGTVTNALQFEVRYPVYSGVAQPKVGQTICVFDADSRKFIPKRILSFTGTGPWVITVDTSNATSNTSYVPTIGQYVMPYSTKLDDFAELTMERYDNLGPGENAMNVINRDPELRGRRFPESNLMYPYTIGTDVFQDIQARADVDSVIPLAGTGYVTSPGSAGIVSYIVIPDDLAFYPALE